jgi:hypothetical protein
MFLARGLPRFPPFGGYFALLQKHEIDILANSTEKWYREGSSEAEINPDGRSPSGMVSTYGEGFPLHAITDMPRATVILRRKAVTCVRRGRPAILSPFSCRNELKPV